MSAWVCRRCNYMSGSAVCPSCKKDNSQPDTVDGKADPTVPSGVLKFLGIALVAAAITAAIVALSAGTGGGAAPALAPAVVTIAALGAAGPASAETPDADAPNAQTPTRPTAPRLPVAPVGRPKPGEKYYLFAVNTSGWSFYIGLPSEVENRAGRSITDGGTGDQPIAYKKLVEQPFNTPQEARDYLKTRVTPGKQSVWTGQWMKFGSEEYRTVHVGGL
jgi:hypothetical protein